MMIVKMPVNNWIWLCEFLSTVLKEGELDPFEREDTERILSLLNNAERGEYV